MLSNIAFIQDGWTLQVVRHTACHCCIVLFQDAKRLGSGGQGAVYMAKYDDTDVAFKELHALSPTNQQALLKEVQHMRTCNHPNVVHVSTALKGMLEMLAGPAFV